MAFFSVPGISILGMAAAVPAHCEHNRALPLLTEQEQENIVEKVGIGTRRVAGASLCASDFCIAAARQVLSSAAINNTAIGLVVFVTQTPDYLLPGNSMLAQQRLGLPSSTLLLDLNQGCAGYVYGLSVIAGMMHTAGIEYGLLLVGDTITRLLSPFDRTTVPIFSDAGSATLLHRTDKTKRMYFQLGADSRGFGAIRIKDGGGRHPFRAESLTMAEVQPGIRRADVHLAMEGIDVLNHSLKNVAPNVEALLANAGCEMQAIDYFVFHQANRILNEGITKKLRIPAEKAPETLSVFGNTSSATIPVTICHRLGKELTAKGSRIVLAGFGVGFSWGSAFMETETFTCAELLEI